MFNEKQITVLNYEVDSSRIKIREKGNISLSYLEAFDIIESANKIFGYGNWSYAVSSLMQVSQEQNHNQNVVICYKAVVRIVAKDITHTKEVSREDVGFGSGIAKTLSDAHEGAAKEAVTDALKRAMRTFGNQFGNSLYDKAKNHSSQPNNNQLPQQPNSQNQRTYQPNNQQQAYQHSNTQIYQQPNNQSQPQQHHLPQDYTSLYNLGLTIIEQGNNLVVIGDDMFSKKDSIKACGFRWDSNSKLWCKPIEQRAA